MDYVKMGNDKVKSALINVETLQKEYEATLKQYQEAFKNYIDILQTTDPKSKTEFTALKGRTWWGTNKIKEGTASSQKDCENMCVNSDKCTGATFNPVKKYCWTRSGDSSVTAGESDDYALIPKSTSALNTMHGLNDKLLSLNKQILAELKNVNPEVKELIREKNIKHKQLSKAYHTLLEQKLNIEKELEEYHSIDQENYNQSLVVNQQSFTMRFWILITAIIMLVTIRKIYGADNPPLSVTIWFIILIILTILTYSLSSPSGFVMWFIVLLVIGFTYFGFI